MRTYRDRGFQSLASRESLPTSNEGEVHRFPALSDLSRPLDEVSNDPRRVVRPLKQEGRDCCAWD